MSHGRLDVARAPVSQQQTGKERASLQEGHPERVRQKTNLPRISDINTSLRFAENSQDVEDELLEASLEKYQ